MQYMSWEELRSNIEQIVSHILEPEVDKEKEFVEGYADYLIKAFEEYLESKEAVETQLNKNNNNLN